MFVSVDGKAKEVTEIFAGGSDGLAHKVNEIYGSVDGVAKLIYNGTPREPNGFDQFTWAQIKELADAGLLLEHFKRYDRVDIKLKSPLHPEGNAAHGQPNIYQDTLPMVISEICETGMRLVAHIATPFRYLFRVDNQLYPIPSDKTVYIGTGEIWGMCEALYEGCKAVDVALPDDMREVLRDFAPIYKYEYYTDHEGKQRLLKEYDDCRVRQITSNGYGYAHRYVEENDREEYILTRTYFARTESGYKKYIPPEIRNLFNDAYGVQSLYYHKDTTSARPYTTYKLMWQNPNIGWIWDWEDYWGTNGRGYILEPIYQTAHPDVSNIVPEVQIGEIPEVFDSLGKK